MGKDIIKGFKKILDDKSKIEKRKGTFYFMTIFFISCITGWIYEEFFYFFADHLVEKRGFLYGPYLPVYGLGSLLMLILLKRWDRKPLVIFGGAMIITGILEYTTGATMMAIWGRRWWDYTGLFLNIDGYACLRSVISFGILALILFYFLEPMVKALSKRVKGPLLIVVPVTITLIFLIDVVLTLVFRNPL